MSQSILEIEDTISRTRKAINQHITGINDALNGLNDILSLVKEIEDDLSKAKSEISRLNATLSEKEKKIVMMEQELQQARNRKKELQEEIEKKEKEIQKLQIELNQVRTEQAIKESEADLLRQQFEQMSELYQADMDARELLSIYIALLEKVFGAKPHAKILYMLHGESESVKREQLNRSLGFEPAVILKALHELRNAGLIEMDEGNEIVRLKKRLY